MSLLPCRSLFSSVVSILLVASVFSLVSSCGGGSSTMNSPSSPGSSSSASAAQLAIGDAPSDQLLAFEITIGPIVLTSPNGANVTMLSTPVQMEMSHLSATEESVSLLNVPSGGYSSAAITIGAPMATFMPSANAPVVRQMLGTSQTVIVNFNAPLTVANTASVVSVDLDLANSITVNPVTRNVAFTPTFNVSTSNVAAENQQVPGDGELEDVLGVVTMINGSSFTLSLSNSASVLTFATNASTQFDAPANLNNILNMIVQVEAVTQSDGSPLATEVELVQPSSGMEVEGIITRVIGMPAQSIWLVDHDGLGAGLRPSIGGTVVSADVMQAHYTTNKSNVDMSNLPFTPQFDGTTIKAGQRIEASSGSSMTVDPTGLTNGAFQAAEVTLEKQTLTGTVTNYTPTGAGHATFDLQLTPNSFLTILNPPVSFITVYQQPGTELHDLTTISNGEQVRVRGLLFFTAPGFSMVAQRIAP